MPPTVKKTLPPARPRPASNGSILSEAIPVTELESLYDKIVIYGKNRTGKTTLACQFPKPLLLVAFEPNMTGGAMSVTRVQGVDFLKIKSCKAAFKLAEELEKDTTYKTVVLDTATSLQTLVLEEITGKPVPEQLDWGVYKRDDYRDRSSKTKEVLRPFLELQVSTVILAQEKDHNPGDKEKPTIIRSMANESFYASDLGGQTVQWLQDACDSICQLYIDKEFVKRVERIKSTTKNAQGQYDYTEQEHWDETGRHVHRLRTRYHPNYAAGIRAPDPSIVPDYVDGDTPEKMYANLMKVIRGGSAK